MEGSAVVRAQCAQQMAHRGILILVLGVVGLAIFPLVGILPWVMGNRDLAAMASGQMDSAGRDLTAAGRIMGIIAVCLVAIPLVIGGSAALIMMGHGGM